MYSEHDSGTVLVLSTVIPLRWNWASAWANQRVALFGQNGGSFTETAETLASEALSASSTALTRSSMMVGCDSYDGVTTCGDLIVSTK